MTILQPMWSFIYPRGGCDVRARDALWLALGALASPLAYEITFRLLGRSTLDPTYRKEKR